MLALRQKNTKFYRSALLEKYNYETRRPPIVFLPARDQAALPLDRIPAIHPCRQAAFLLPITAPRPAGLPGPPSDHPQSRPLDRNAAPSGPPGPPCVRARVAISAQLDSCQPSSPPDCIPTTPAATNQQACVSISLFSYH
jgi:hypothetical protein